MSEQGERLQKVMAHAGVGSRRSCEDLIEQGRVSIDGKTVTRLGTRVTPDQIIRVDGERITFDESKVTIALHKPAGVVSTMDDDMGRESLAQFVEMREERLYHVGRLDTDTEGLILLSNDGDLTHRLTHPSYEVPKTYVATVEGQVNRSIIRRLEEGVTLEDGFVKADKVKIIEMGLPNSIVEITLHSGANRVVRRMFEAVRHPVVRLVRTEFGTIGLGRLKPGRSRVIGGSELAALMKSVDL
ncbi:pseudouridine synthase [Flaviflexus massiliensis]|uniref:pseudouridine synthase n=1 Tax=Flaviflexus massiliensis TaxID=1522309 RepID=UPI0006D59238|nr:pseudouridine synthase [Flaviflexus massiliensis]